MKLMLEKKGHIYMAICWTGENLKDVIEFTGKAPKFNKWFKNFQEYEQHVITNGNVFKLFSNVGHVNVVVGEYLLKSQHGRLTVMHPWGLKSCTILEKY